MAQYKMLDGNGAAVQAVSMADVKVVAAYPITPQSPIAEKLSDMIARKTMDAQFIRVESEHSAMSVCLGAQLTGVRAVTATSSVGLALMHEVCGMTSGCRLPMVMHVVNRSLAAPWSLWCDHSDTMAERDSGWLQFYAGTVQDVLDLYLAGIRISEHPDVLTPSMICQDGFITSHGVENILLEEVAVKRREEKGHIFTTEADAFHFVCCRGWILVKGCLCENQLDDALNVHGIYGRVKQVEEDGSFLLELAHGQQKGVELLRAGETFQCLETEHMEPFAEGKVKRAERLNKDYIEVFPQEAVPGLKAGHVVENLDWRPKVTVEGCVFRNNRARGLLCTGIGQAWIKGNTFQTPGAGILIEGDANEWFESGSAQHIVIEGNLFDGCAYIRGWGKVPIQITPRVASPLEGKHFHKKIEIKGNVFRRAHPQALRAYQVGELVWKGNRIEDKEDYQDTGEPVFCVEHVGVWEKDGMEGRQESVRHTQG